MKENGRRNVLKKKEMCQPEIKYELEVAGKFKLFFCGPLVLTLFLGGIRLIVSRISCISSLQSPMMAVEGLFTIISLVGLLLVCSKKPVAAWIPLIVTLLVVALHLFTIVLTYVTVSGDVRDSGYFDEVKEYRIEDYSKWLREKVDTDSKWNKVRSCEVRSSCKVEKKVCGRRVGLETSPIQSGCCKPPLECGFEQQAGGMVWDKPAVATITSNNTDCAAWSNDRSVLCYDCQSCKAAVLAITRSDWERLAVPSMVILVFYGLILVSIFTSVCNAWRKRRKAMDVPETNDTSLPIRL